MQSTIVPRKGIAYLDSNRNRMQKPIEGLSVLALFANKRMLKAQKAIQNCNPIKRERRLIAECNISQLPKTNRSV